MKIILDTSILFSSFNLRINLLKELERITEEPFTIVISSGIKKEIKGIKGGKKGIAARVVMKLLDKLRPEVIKDDGEVDEWILSYAEKGMVVCTVDRALKEELRKKGIKVITIKKKRVLGYV